MQSNNKVVPLFGYSQWKESIELSLEDVLGLIQFSSLKELTVLEENDQEGCANRITTILQAKTFHLVVTQCGDDDMVEFNLRDGRFSDRYFGGEARQLMVAAVAKLY